MRISVREIRELLSATYAEWSNDQAARLGAALAYYAVFSLAPLLLILIAAVELVWIQQSAALQAQVLAEIEGVVGTDGAEMIRSMLENRSLQGTGGTVALITGAGILLLAATGVFAQLQGALNTLWRVKLVPGQPIRNLIRTRLLSFGLILFAGLLVFVMLVVSAAIAPMEPFFAETVPGGAALIRIANVLVSLALLTLLFAVIFYQLPDVSVAWRDVWIGAAFTAVLFALGKAGLGWYLGRASVASAYGAAGSFVVLLLWIYYSALIFLFGAEFTQVYARRRGSSIQPASYAAYVSRDVEPPPSSEESAPVSDVSSSGGWGRRIGLIAVGFLIGRYFGRR